MRVLLYGFKPFLHYKENVTEKILKKIKMRRDLKKVVFDVRFNKKQFIDEVRSFHPDIVIGLGQHPRGKKLRIERKAVNGKKHKKRDPSKPIRPRGHRYLFSTLSIQKTEDNWFSYDAGEYVCNFSMYVILDHIKASDIRYAFIHIPQDYSIEKASRWIERLLD